MIELSTLGVVEVKDGDGHVLEPLLAQPKRLALLVYLALGNTRLPHRRDSVVALFWPELDQEHARAALRQAVRFLRSHLGEGVVQGRTEEELAVSAAALRCDARAFEAACGTGRAEEAMRLYRGAFLDGFHVADVAPEFEQWVDAERARLRQRAAEAAWVLAEQGRAQGDLKRAAERARRAASLAGDDEAGVRRLITFLAELGDRAGALHVYADFAARLRAEFDAEPGAETRTLIDQVRARDVAAQPRAASELAAAPLAPDRERVRPRWRTTGIVIALVVGVGAGIFAWSRGPKVIPANSVAVLYFESLSTDTADAYLADGLTEDVTAKLGQIGRLAVTSRAAVRRRRDAAAMPTAALGRTLNVAYLVSGRIQRSSARLRVTVELVRAATGARVWGDQYDRTAADLLSIQEDVARAVVTGIAGQLLPTERATLAARPTRSPEAYDHYLRGNRFMWRSNVEGSVSAAIAEYKAALRLDSTFTAARGRLSSAYGLALNWSFHVERQPEESVLARAFEAAERALSEDSTVADAWIGRAWVLFFGGKREDLGAALESARRAVELNPADDAAHQWYSSLLRRLGHFAEAEQELHRALLANPERVVALSDLGFLNYSLRRFTEARSWMDSAIALDSTLTYSYAVRARVRGELGDLAGALRDAETGLRIAAPNERPRAAALLAEMQAKNGQVARARELLDSVFTELGWPDGVPRMGITVRNCYDPALAAIALGDIDVSIAIVEHARPRGPWLWSYLIMPGFDPVRGDPRFVRVYQESRPPGVP